MLNNARFYSSLGMNVIPCNFKLPTVMWADYASAPLPDAPSQFDWDVNSIGGISGINDFVVFDFDKADKSFLPDILKLLNLPPAYSWVIESGSGNGFHIWFRFKKNSGFINKFGDKAYVMFYPKNSKMCDHIELRLRNCYTLLPPSSHISGLAYSFFFSEPDSQPPYIPVDIIESFILDNFLFTPPHSSHTSDFVKTPLLLTPYVSDKLKSACQYLSGHLPSGSYITWNKLGLALCSLGIDGLPFFLILSDNPNYNDSENNLSFHFRKLLQSYNGSISVASVFFIAKSFGWKPPFFPFWSPSKHKTKFDFNKYINFLIDNNFYKILFNDVYYFCYTENYFIKYVNEVFFKDYVFNYVKNLPEFSGNKKSHSAILDFIIQDPLLFKKATLEFLPSLDLKIQSDTEKESFFFFKNCYLKITADDMQSFGYETLEAHVFSDSVIPRNFKKEYTPSVFEKFCFNVCDKDPRRFDSLRSSIGYLLHTFKNPASAKAIVFTDENISDGAAGRSGKSLLAKSISYIRNLIDIDGKNFSFHDRFAFQRVTPSSEIVLFNDVDKSFSFEKLYNIISDSFTVQRKNQTEFVLPFQRSPKLVITGNNAIKNSDPSAKARLFEIEFSSYYNIFRTPVSEFNKRFFDSWDEDEWNAFFTFMAACLQFYLKYGLFEYNFVNLLKKKVVDTTSIEFFDFFHQIIVFNQYHNKIDFLKDFKEQEPTFSELKSHTFYKWVKYYAITYNYTYVEKRMGTPQTRYFAILKPETII